MVSESSLCCNQLYWARLIICIAICIIATVWCFFAKMQRIVYHHAMAVIMNNEGEMHGQLFRWLNGFKDKDDPDSKEFRFNKRFSIYIYIYKGRYLEYFYYLTLISGGPLICVAIYNDYSWILIILISILFVALIHIINNMKNHRCFYPWWHDIRKSIVKLNNQDNN